MSLTSIIDTLPPAPSFPGQRLNQLTKGRSETFRLDPLSMRPDGGNERSEFQGIEDLAMDLLLNGQQHPITVRRGDAGEILVVYGERRWRAGIHIRTTLTLDQDPSIAAKAADFLLVCRSEPPHTKPIDRLFGQLSENSGHSFSLLEKARLYHRIMEADPSITEAELARRSQSTRQAVNQAVSLVRFGAPDLLRLVEQSKLSASTAVEIIGRHKDNWTAQVEAAKIAIEVAQSLGKDKATPKHLPEKPPKTTRPGISFTLKSRKQQEPSEHGVFKDPSTFTASGIPKSWHLTAFTLSLAYYHKQWAVGHNIQGKGEGMSAPCTLLNVLDPAPASEKQAWLQSFRDATHALERKFPDMVKSLREAFIAALDAEYPGIPLDTDDSAPWSDDTEEQPSPTESTTTTDEGPDLFPIGETYGDAAGEDEGETEPVTVVDDTRPSSPDPGAIERIKAAPSTNRDGSSGPGEGGFSPPDKQAKKIDDLLDKLDRDGNGVEDRILTVEIVMRVIRNESPITDLRKHLTA